jgi:hypothetical protein
MNAPSPTYLNVFTVDEYTRGEETARSWTKIGVAFPHHEGSGFNVELKAFPRDGKLVILPPDSKEETDEAPPAPAPTDRGHRPPSRERRR